MKTVAALSVKTHFSSLLKAVQKGEKVMITKNGHPVAQLVPVQTITAKEKIQQTIQKIKLFSQSNLLKWDWKKLRDEGRR